MFQKVALFFCILFIQGCAGQDFQQQDARYTGAYPATMPLPADGQVLVQASTNYERSKLHQLIWGKHYRQVWAAPVLVNVLNLQKLPVQLTPKKLGGGLQTTSLSFQDAQGRAYTLRTLEKDPSKSLSPGLQKTVVSSIMRDQTSAINPYAAFTVPTLAEAAGVFHTNPQLFYVPATTSGLGDYNSNFAGKVTMLEEKFEQVVDLSADFGPVAEVIGTEELFNRLNQSPIHFVDQKAMARARLLDVILGDWDRHEGQWTWAKYSLESGRNQYKPIPKDRDYVFYRYQDGALTWLLSRRLLFGYVKSFIHNIPDVGGLIYKSRALDNRMLNKLTAQEWEAIATDMQAALTDEVLQRAIRNFPETVYKLEGENTFRFLKKKVKQLPDLAKEYYQLLAEEVTVLGTEEKEKFLIKMMPDKNILIEVYTIPGNTTDNPKQLYHRVFKPIETKVITLDALGNADEYVIEGNARKGPKILIQVQKELDTVSGKVGARKIKLSEKIEKRKSEAKA